VGIAVCWIALCFLAGWIAAQKGRSGAGFFFLSLFLSPLIGILAAFGARSVERVRHAADYVMPPMAGTRSVNQVYGIRRD